jgi:NADP-dependent 3-hydroxy acid dehydrogenase YdfG
MRRGVGQPTTIFPPETVKRTVHLLRHRQIFPIHVCGTTIRLPGVTDVIGKDGEMQNIAVVTGASSGIGAATARRLAAEGFHVVAAARRADRLAALAEEIGPGATAVECDVTSDESVAGLAAAVARIDGTLTLLVNNAGGARGLDEVAGSPVGDWQWMYDVNVLGTLRVTQALLPALETSGRGTIVAVGSTAAFVVYEGGGGYSAAKHAQNALIGTLRLELSGKPVRVMEIDPGMVRTDEFSLNRLGGDRDRADAIYEGVKEPLVADDIADCIAFVATRPHHVNIDRLVVRPLAQAAQHKVYREK